VNDLKYKSVIAFGDSHSAGCELEKGNLLVDNLIIEYLSGEISLAEMDNFTKPLAYPQYVADKLGIPCYNYAMSGSSNERSLRILPAALAEHPDSLVLFGYTEQNRREFYYNDPGKFLAMDDSNYIQSGIPWYKNPATKMAKKYGNIHPFNDYFVENMMRWKQGDHTSIVNAMFYAEKACSDIVHILLFKDLYDSENPVSQLLDTTKILNFNNEENSGYGDYQSWSNLKGFSQLSMGHYDTQAHDQLGELILNHISSNSTYWPTNPLKTRVF
jgi:hypothetical protein